ncbi:TetR/AcrR family transcriptional regulator [uncultured Ruegeria sp.]|uniref:TetR/AcrR family transcriptional regulator n=1 Tax=uncultured Ruegeria sp. TaxID=259304 RepID=UPI002611464B|nr:TetR/AcrR family transcriptional regulator [uncultured Ruegeria sp.]
MPKVVDKAKMRGEILDAAMKVFVEKGYHASSVSDVARAASLAKGTLYIYFDGKDAMTKAIVDRHFAMLEDRITQGQTCETLDAFLDELNRTMDIPTEQASFLRVFFEVFGPSFASEDFSQHVARFFDRLGAHYANQISHLQERKQVAEHYEAASIGRALASMMDGVVLHMSLFDITRRRHRRLVREAISMLGAGLRPASASND